MRLGLGNNLVKTAFPIGTSPSLDLAFALDRSFTTDPAAAGNALIPSRRGPAAKFSRGMGATQVNTAGLIEYAPENLLTRSEEFNDAVWTTARASVSAIQVASPSGTITADKIVVDTSVSNNHRIDRAAVALTTNTVYTFSVFVKASEYSGFAIGVNPVAPVIGVQFDLTGSGSVTLQASGYVGTIQDVGNGWFRCRATFTSDASTSVHRIYTYVGQNGTTFSYTGDDTSGIFLWGAQLERASIARTYYPTTTAAFYGPRFDYDPTTGASKGLLIEDTRTNLLRESQALDNSSFWTGVSATVTVAPNNQISPDGLQNAETLTIASSLAGGLYQSVTCTANTVYTFSFYVKLGTFLASNFLFAVRDDVGNVFIAENVVPSVTPVTGEWRRITYTFTTPAGCTTVRPYVYRNNAPTASGTVFIWGAQLEAGAFATSYIPTTSGTAARSADVCSIIGTDFSSFYNQSEGTLLTDSIPQTVNGTSTVFGVSNGTSNERFLNRFAPAEQAVITSNNVESQLDATNPIAGTRYKIAVGVKLNDLALSLNGASVVTDTLQPMPTVDRAGIGNPLGVAAGGAMHIARIQYFRKRLPNEKLQSLTYPDDDADAYIAKVELMLGDSIYSALPNATSDAKRIITDFIKAEKDASRWALHKRIYLPIYNNSAANAVDAVSLTSGTFFGGITHAAGYFQGNGTSGYFDTIVNWNTLVALDNATIGTINLTANPLANMNTIGVGASIATAIRVGSQNSGLTPQCAWAGAGIVRVNVGTSGIQIASRSNGVTRMIRRSSTGITEEQTSNAITGSLINYPITIGANNSGGFYTGYSTARIGGGIISAGLDSTQLAAYSLNLKNLYESLTGLNLPA